MVGVWYLVSLDIATREQITQSGFNAITQFKSNLKTILFTQAFLQM